MSEGALDHHRVINMLEAKRDTIEQNVLPPNISLTIRLCSDQVQQGSLIVSRLKLLCNRETSLIHLSMLMAFKNDLGQDEWPNFEFYPDTKTTQLNDHAADRLQANIHLRPFRFNQSIDQILQLLFPHDDSRESLDLIYRKKHLPQMVSQRSMVQQIQMQTEVK